MFSDSRESWKLFQQTTKRERLKSPPVLGSEIVGFFKCAQHLLKKNYNSGEKLPKCRKMFFFQLETSKRTKLVISSESRRKLFP